MPDMVGFPFCDCALLKGGDWTADDIEGLDLSHVFEVGLIGLDFEKPDDCGFTSDAAKGFGMTLDSLDGAVDAFNECDDDDGFDFAGKWGEVSGDDVEWFLFVIKPEPEGIGCELDISLF